MADKFEVMWILFECIGSGLAWAFMMLLLMVLIHMMLALSINNDKKNFKK